MDEIEVKRTQLDILNKNFQLLQCANEDNLTPKKQRKQYDLNFMSADNSCKKSNNKNTSNLINVSKFNQKNNTSHVYSNTQSSSLSNNYRIRQQKVRQTKYPISQSNQQVFYSQKSINLKKSIPNDQKSQETYKRINNNQPSFTMKIIDNHQRMKYKFEKLYEKIQRISMKEEIGMHHRQNSFANKSLIQPFSYKKKLHNFDQIVKTTVTDMFKVRANSIQHKKITQTIQRQLKSLEVHNVIESKNASQLNYQETNCPTGQDSRPTNIGSNVSIQASLMRGRIKRKNLQPLKKAKMSNNIRDYLSVQKIQIRQIQESIIEKHTQLNRKIQQRKSNLMNLSTYKPLQPSESNLLKKKNSETLKTYNSVPNNIIRISKFKNPFQLYTYRDFIWKVGYSNNFLVQFPEQYENKIKVFVGKGNNSNLIKGIIKRRTWYQITDKYQQANVVWTQIKVQSYFNLQKSVSKEQNFVNFQQYKEKKTNRNNIKKQSISIFNQIQNEKFNSYWKSHIDQQRKMKQNMKIRTKIIKTKQNKLQNVIKDVKIHNHFKNNFMIGNKKALFHTMTQYYNSINQSVFDNLPLTFHVKNGLQDDEYLKFLQNFYAISKQIKKLSNPQTQQNNLTLEKYIYKHNAWIVKPGQNTNRGNGIIVCLSLQEIKSILKKKEKHDDGTYKTYIIQKYIEKPLLYKKRKFDLRHYMMMVCTNGIKKGYWYKEGYVRTTSSEYTLKFSSGAVHLTNDAVQKHLPDYGKYQKGNKLSYQELNAYIRKNDKQFDFWKIIYPKMKKIATDSMRASALLMDPEKKINNFEVFGMDFMIDQDYNVWLIQINANPCLELSCPILGRVIPRMIENTFKICLDPIFTPPTNYIPKNMQHFQNVSDENYYELVYDQRIDSVDSQIADISTNNQKFQEEDDVFQDDGDAWDED